MFCHKNQRNESLPPTSDSLEQHLKRADYEAYVWKHSLVAVQKLLSPAGYSWNVIDGKLVPVHMSKEPAPTGLIELTFCKCKKSGCKLVHFCQCKANGLFCTDACMDEETCENQPSVCCLEDDSDGDC